MKKLILLSLSILTFFNVQAQNKTTKRNKRIERIEIDLESSVLKKSTVKSPGTYKIVLLKYNPEKSYEIDIKRDYHEYSTLSFPKTDSVDKLIQEQKTIANIILSRGQDLSIKIDIFKTETDKKGKPVVKKEKTFNYEYKTERKGKWQTTFGFNFIALGNKDSYFSKQVDSTYSITKGTNQNKIDFHPSIMFTWLPNNSETFNLGITGGLGYDLEKSLSVFFGGSLVYNQNITLSAGFAFHNQKLLNSQYKEGDVLKENLTFEQLHKDYIRFNPFISIAFRLDKSPF